MPACRDCVAGAEPAHGRGRAGGRAGAEIHHYAVPEGLGRHRAHDRRFTAFLQPFEIAEEEEPVPFNGAPERAAEDVFIELRRLVRLS